MPLPSKLSKAKNWKTVLEYAESIRDGRKIACVELKQAIDRFFADLENPEYEMDPKAPEFCIGIIEKTLCHQQGEKLDGTPLRGTPFLLEPFHKFIIYNLVGFKLAWTDIVPRGADIHSTGEHQDLFRRFVGVGVVPVVSQERGKDLHRRRSADADVRELQLFGLQRQADGRRSKGRRTRPRHRQQQRAQHGGRSGGRIVLHPGACSTATSQSVMRFTLSNSQSSTTYSKRP